jgi:hypothetical protein
MMFRSNWATSSNQERVVAIWLKKSAFEKYLESAKLKGSTRGFGTVRLQWDPDHLPDGSHHVYRRAVQLGLKNIKGFASGEDILDIQDVTDFVHEQAAKLPRRGQIKDESFLVARERVYVPDSDAARNSTELNLTKTKKT